MLKNQYSAITNRFIANECDHLLPKNIQLQKL